MITIGLANLARSVTEVTLKNIDSNELIIFAFLDSMMAAELLIRARILEVEVEKSEAVSKLKVNELVYGSSKLSSSTISRSS